MGLRGRGSAPMSTGGKDGAATTGRSGVQMGSGDDMDGGVVGGNGLSSKTRVLISMSMIPYRCASLSLAFALSLLLRGPGPGVTPSRPNLGGISRKRGSEVVPQ